MIIYKYKSLKFYLLLLIILVIFFYFFIDKYQKKENIVLKPISINLLTNVHPNLSWDFKPVKAKIVVKPGEVTIIEYVVENLGDTISTGIATFAYFPNQFGNYITKINNLIKKISKKSGITNGSLKGDLVIYKKKIYVVEIAARLSGGYFSSKMIPEYNGFNLIKKVAEIYLGNKVDISKKNVQKKFISQRFFFPKVGKIKSIKIPKWIKKSKNLVYFELNVSKGDTIKNIKNHTDRVGQIIVKSKNRKNSQNIINKMIKSVVFKY